MGSSSLRVLLITHGLPPDSVGGVEQHVSGLAEALVAAGHEVSIFTRSSRPGEQGELHDEEWHGCRVTRAVYRWEGLTALADLYRCELMEAALAHFLDRSAVDFDVAHVHHLTGLSTGAVAVLRERGIPVLLTLHDYWIMCPRGQMFHRNHYPCESVEPRSCAECLAPTFPDWLPEAKAEQRVGEIHDLARDTLGQVDQLLTPSPRTIPFYEKLGIPEERIAVVENGVDTATLGTVAPPAMDGPLRVGYLGTLIPSKGLDVLVDAMSRLPRETATLTVHGNAVPYHGDEGFLTRVFQQLTPASRVSYHGPYRTNELPDLLAGIDVLVVPALWHEAFGLTVREAQAAGRAVVVSRIGGVQDAVRNGVEGLVVPPGDADALAEALAALAANRDLVVAMGRAGQARARGFAAMADDLVALYRRTRT